MPSRGELGERRGGGVGRLAPDVVGFRPGGREEGREGGREGERGGPPDLRQLTTHSSSLVVHFLRLNRHIVFL